jgi:small subunit ribosomal protein S17
MIAARKSILKVSQCVNNIVKNVPPPTLTQSHFTKNNSQSICRYLSSLGTNSVNLPDPSTIFGYDEDIKNMTDEDLNDITTIPGFTTLIHSMPRDETTPRNALVGKVVSDKMQKTVNVAVDRYKIIPKYRKRKKYTKKFFAHDEHEVCATGDLVMIVPCQRISRHKHFRVHEIIKRKGFGNEE